MYNCNPANIYRINERGFTKNTWLNVVANTFEDEESEEIVVNFFGLIKTNEKTTDSGNYCLHNSILKTEITIFLNNDNDPVTFQYAKINTLMDNSAFISQLGKYCTPSPLTKWVKLDDYANDDIWTLTVPNIHPSVEHPSTIFTFPSFTTMEDIIRLEERSVDRHHCNIIPCNEFLVCPSTREEPSPTLPPHGHCTADPCVRYFEMNTIPPNPTFLNYVD